MGVVQSTEYNSPDLSQHLLIAAQDSEFKNSITTKVVEEFQENCYIKLIDVTELGDIESNEWDAIFILHVFEVWKPQRDVKAFMDKTRNRDKIFVFSTSGSGTELLENVDGISGASVLSEVDEKAQIVIDKINSILSANSIDPQPAH